MTRQFANSTARCLRGSPLALADQQSEPVSVLLRSHPRPQWRGCSWFESTILPRSRRHALGSTVRDQLQDVGWWETPRQSGSSAFVDCLSLRNHLPTGTAQSWDQDLSWLLLSSVASQ